MKFLTILFVAIFATLMMAKIAQSETGSTKAGDFFIVSSVDLAKKQILLKRPTEVTELMRLDGETRYFDERGKAIQLTDLRAGDTVYITSKPSGGPSLAMTISKGPMTMDVLRERYLKSPK